MQLRSTLIARMEAALGAEIDAHVAPRLPKHSRSPIAKARRQRLKRQKARARKQLAAVGAEPQRPLRFDRLARAQAAAFARGVAAERGAAKTRRGAKRTTKKASKAQVRASKRAARRRKAARL